MKHGGVSEDSAGAVLVRGSGAGAEALVIRVRKKRFEVPKGHVEGRETAEQTALRELREETGLISPVDIGAAIGALEYSFDRGNLRVAKRVQYFLARARADETLKFGALPRRTAELRWVSADRLADLALVNEGLRAVIAKAMVIAAAVRGTP